MVTFIEVMLRGAMLASLAVALGGVAFTLLVLRPLALSEPDPRSLLRRTLALTALGALGVGAAQPLYFALQIGSLADDAGWPLSQILATAFSRAGLIRLAACLGLASCCWILSGRPGARLSWTALVSFALVLGGSASWMSHAAARLEHRGLLMGLDAIHQVAAAVWVGGLVHLVTFAFRAGQRPGHGAVLRRFSTMALAAVGGLVAAGVGLAVYYVDGVQALVGTAYGAMVLTKAVILAGLLTLGGMNFRAVRRLSGDVTLQRVWRFVEVEVGLGITVLFTAASLSSLPPAVDVEADRATLAEVSGRFTPRWPVFATPTLEELLASAAPLMDLRPSRKPEEYAWSEYNHHVAGLFLVVIGLFAALERTGRTRWARHWPLLFLGLAGVLFVRNDPRAWPLGPAGFWESMTFPDVLQHRLFVLLVVAFGLFEWLVRTGRLRSPRCALVFPLLSAIAGGFLLTHSHAMFSLKAEFLTEVTHTPLGMLGMFVGWSRWLELRLPPPDNLVPGRLWTLGLALVGTLLLLYREA